MTRTGTAKTRLTEKQLEGTRWIYFDLDSTSFDLDNTSFNRIIEFRPNNKLYDNKYPKDTNYWEIKNSQVIFNINDGFVSLEGNIKNEKLIEGRAKSKSGETWKWKAEKIPIISVITPRATIGVRG